MLGFGKEKDFEEERESGSRGLHIVSAPNLTMAIRTPSSLDDILSCGKLLLEGAALVVNYENLGEEERIRAMDYLSGASYAIDDGETEILPDVILYVPKGVGVITGEK
jgi:FtsZ-interacting cell division protein YlmF